MKSPALLAVRTAVSDANGATIPLDATLQLANAGQLQIAGNFAYDNVFLIDGVDVNDNRFGTANNLLIPFPREYFRVGRLPLLGRRAAV